MLSTSPVQQAPATSIPAQPIADETFCSWLYDRIKDIFQKIISWLCCCMGDTPSTAASPGDLIPYTTFDQLKASCPELQRWLQEDRYVQLSYRYIMGSSDHVQRGQDVTRANYPSLSEEGCRNAFEQDILRTINSHQNPPNFKYCIELTFSKRNPPNMDVTLLFRNCDFTFPAPVSASAPVATTPAVTSPSAPVVPTPAATSPPAPVITTPAVTSPSAPVVPTPAVTSPPAPSISPTQTPALPVAPFSQEYTLTAVPESFSALRSIYRDFDQWVNDGPINIKLDYTIAADDNGRIVCVSTQKPETEKSATECEMIYSSQIQQRLPEFNQANIVYCLATIKYSRSNMHGIQQFQFTYHIPHRSTRA